MPASIQRSFAAGELAPALWGRADTTKYATGLRTCRNFVVRREGGITNRAGSEFICEVKNSAATLRLIPFIFNADQTYVLEFSNLFMRVIRDGAQVTETAVNITGATAANPVVVTAVAHGYSNGDEVFISGVGGMTQLNNRNFKVAGVTANTFQLQDLQSTNINGTAYTAYTSGGTVAKIYQIATPYATADLMSLQYVQQADIMTIVHPSYAPRKLTRTGHALWSLNLAVFTPSISYPVGITVTSGGAGARTYRYRVTAVKEGSLEESLTGLEDYRSVSVDVTTTPWTVTDAGHPYSTGDEIYVTDVNAPIVNISGLTNEYFIITSTGANTYTLNGTVLTTGGPHTQDVGRTFGRINNAQVPTTAAPHVIAWDAVSGALEYNVYRELNGIYGYIGTAGSNTFNDENFDVDLADTPPIDRDLFSAADTYPAAVGLYQQRKAYANSNDEPESVWMSRTVHVDNFTIASPVKDDDAITFTIAGRQVNSVRHLVDVGRLIILTAGGAWIVDGDADGVVSPSAINLRQQGYTGASTLSPVIVGNTAIFVQARGSIVRDLRYDLQADGYQGRDLTIFSSHLFDGKTISDMAYAEIPNSLVWLVRSDGKLLALTYVREHDVWGWSRHDFTDGTVENVCVVPEGDEDAVYLVVKRTINSVTKRYIERFETRYVTDVTIDARFLDSHLVYDGRNTNGSHTMTLTGGTDWLVTETLTLTSSTSYFTSADVGNAIILQTKDADGVVTDFVILTITAYTSGTVVSVRPSKTVPAAFRSTAIAVWVRAVDEITGLWHLEGESIVALADGNVERPAAVVTAGAVTLSRPFGVICAGLAYTCDAESLDLEIVSGETLVDKQKRMNRVTLLVESSRGIFAGPDADHLREYKQRQLEDYNEAVNVVTGPVEVVLNATWNNNGRWFVRQSDPLPLTILAAAPSGTVGG